MQYIEILPLKRTGPEENCFTYHTDEEVEVGSIVKIPLRNRTTNGLVIRFAEKPSFKTRPVEKILSKEPVLTKQQIIIAEKISQYYLSNLSETINTMLPFDIGKKRRTVEAVKNIPQKYPEIKPTTSQEGIISKIKSSQKGSKHLLFGVTGSGKTEVYLRLTEQALADGKGVIILIPEISLTPQTAKRFTERFGDKVAIWHSHLKETEKFKTWQGIREGEKQIVLGARSAIFTPIKNLEFIIIDEEHESSYKQDQSPRYETSKVAEWISELSGAKVIFGSATPRIDSYYKAKNNDYHLHVLDERIVSDQMPPVRLVDLRDEFKKGNKSIISDDLFEAITNTLKDKKQVVLFVNRRGASTFVMCRECGEVEICPSCEIPLTFHLGDTNSPGSKNLLKCHHCEYKKPVPLSCAKCNSLAIKYFGLGTQKAEVEVKKLFPRAKVARMDRDTTRKRGSHEEIYNNFLNQDVDILIGTQIIAKGWDLPNVDLVGVLASDTMLNFPDYKSAERTFSLLTQVAGRTGRGKNPGAVLIQTYDPEHYAIQAAKKHDYLDFYEREIKSREKYLYPPFCELIKLTYQNPILKKAEQEAENMATTLHQKLDKEDKVIILGPTPAFLPKIAGKFRWQIILKVTDTESVRDNLKTIIKKEAKAGWVIDVNPETLL